jgi:chorismate dehydratase
LKDTKLIIGKITYANLFPIFYYFEREVNNSNYKFINGVPSHLNRMLREGRLDISPSSSVEYLRYKEKYSLIPFFSISSSGPVKSILLFSRYPLEELDKKTIIISPDSETSVVVLKIILKEFLSMDCKFETKRYTSLHKILSSFPAILLIGDIAMREAKKLSIPYIYDLGELWHKYTGLPCVFALCIVRKESLSQKKDLIKRFSIDLINAKEYASKKSSLIAKHAPQRKWFGERGLINYWKGISYDFTDKHLEGLKLLERYIIKMHMSD